MLFRWHSHAEAHGRSDARKVVCPNPGCEEHYDPATESHEHAPISEAFEEMHVLCPHHCRHGGLYKLGNLMDHYRRRHRIMWNQSGGWEWAQPPEVEVVDLVESDDDETVGIGETGCAGTKLVGEVIVRKRPPVSNILVTQRQKQARQQHNDEEETRESVENVAGAGDGGEGAGERQQQLHDDVVHEPQPPNVDIVSFCVDATSFLLENTFHYVLGCPICRSSKPGTPSWCHGTPCIPFL